MKKPFSWMKNPEQNVSLHKIVYIKSYVLFIKWLSKIIKPHQISLLKWVLKYNVTLETVIIAAENFCHFFATVTGINYILKYIILKRATI